MTLNTDEQVSTSSLNKNKAKIPQILGAAMFRCPADTSAVNRDISPNI